MYECFGANDLGIKCHRKQKLPSKKDNQIGTFQLIA